MKLIIVLNFPSLPISLLSKTVSPTSACFVSSLILVFTSHVSDQFLSSFSSIESYPLLPLVTASDKSFLHANVESHSLAIVPSIVQPLLSCSSNGPCDISLSHVSLVQFSIPISSTLSMLTICLVSLMW